jgi:DNA-binding CsgD family transcriptional regulator
MRALGYTNKEISKELHISAWRARNTYYRVRDEFIRRFNKNVNHTWQ